MWSAPVIDQLPANGKVLSAHVSQGFPGFPRIAVRTSASRSQMWRGTNSAIPGYSVFVHYSTEVVQIKVFPVCGHSCGQSGFGAGFGAQRKSRKHRHCKAFQRSTFTRPGYSRPTPKAGALPAALHPDIWLSSGWGYSQSHTPERTLDYYNPSPQAMQAFINILLTIKILAILAEFVRPYW